VTGEFTAQPDELQAAGQSMVDVAGRLATAWQGLQATVQGMGELFGEDMVSSLIGMSYGAAQEMAAESFGSAAESLGWFGDGLAAMADQYRAAEAASAAAIDDVGARAALA